MSTTNANRNAPEINNNEKFNAMLNSLEHGREVFNILNAVATSRHNTNNNTGSADIISQIMGVCPTNKDVDNFMLLLSEIL
ncbi:MAG: hypothetical protein PUC76_05220 [Clostridia bacterium]|nr:hypothetical protein [Clostridia bacterium]